MIRLFRRRRPIPSPITWVYRYAGVDIIVDAHTSAEALAMIRASHGSHVARNCYLIG